MLSVGRYTSAPRSRNSADFCCIPRLHLLLARCVVADVLGDLHAAELGAAHAAEVRDLGALGRQGFVVVRQRGHRVQRQVELVALAERHLS